MLGHQVTMRKDDHQILSEYFVGVFTKGVKYDSEKTGLGWKTEVTVPAQGPRPAQHLQDEAAELSCGPDAVPTARSRRDPGGSPWKSSSSRC